jgi:hypothetical protein
LQTAADNEQCVHGSARPSDTNDLHVVSQSNLRGRGGGTLQLDAEQSLVGRAGSGSFEGLRGDGQMKVEFEKENPEEGLARFTGTIGP